MNNLINIIEAILFASGSAIKKSEILEKMPEEVTKKHLNDAIKALEQKYSGDSGIILEVFSDKLQFASNHMYGDYVEEILRPVKTKELTKILMEVLSIIAYRQPITRGEIEDIRGVSADYALSVLCRVNLIKTKGYKQAPGRPAYYVTTEDFLKKFGLRSIDMLPDYAEIMKRLVEFGNFNVQQEGLYREVNLADDFQDNISSVAEQQLNELENFIGAGEEYPDFLKDETIDTFEGDGSQAVASDVADDLYYRESFVLKTEENNEESTEENSEEGSEESAEDNFEEKKEEIEDISEQLSLDLDELEVQI